MPCTASIARTRRRRRRGFSLVELLVVILVITILMGILLPVLGKMRKTARNVDTAALINTIRSACEAYHSNFKAYPGPFSDRDVYTAQGWDGQNGIPSGISDGQNNPVTGTEQLVLALCGGLKLDLRNNDVVWNRANYTPGSGGGLAMPSGPANLNPRDAKTYQPYISDANKFITPNWDGTSNFKDAAGNVGQDTNLPEFVDRYPSEELPILYLRARKGADGIIGDKGTPPYQYDLRQVTGYTKLAEGVAGTPQHGLRVLGNVNQSIKDSMAANGGGADALPYFRVPGGTLPSNFAPNNQKGASPRSRDSFILISAGPDRIYGTYDDIASFGNLE